MKEEDGFKEFFQDLLKERKASIITDKFKQKNSHIIKYEFFNEREVIDDNKVEIDEAQEPEKARESNFSEFYELNYI